MEKYEQNCQNQPQNSTVIRKMEQELPESIFRDFRNDQQHQTITWINTISTINARPQLYYPKLLQQICQGSKKGETCLQFVHKMGVLGKLVSSNNSSLCDLFEFLTKKTLNQSVEELERSQDLQVMVILLLSEELNKKYFSLLVESCLEVLKDGQNQHQHPLVILNSFLQKLHKVANGMARGPKIEHEWLEVVISETLLDFKNFHHFQLNSEEKLDSFLQISKALVLVCRNLRSSLMEHVVEKLPELLCLELLKGEQIGLIKGSRRLSESIFQMLALSSMRLFMSSERSPMETEILGISQKYILQSGSITEFWGCFLCNMEICQNLPLSFSDILFENYYLKARTTEEAVNKLKVTSLIIKCSSIQVKFNEINSIRGYFMQEFNNPEARERSLLLRLALEALYRPNISMQSLQTKSVLEELHAIEELIDTFFKEAGALLETQILNALPILKILAHTHPKLLAESTISKSMVYFCFHTMAKHRGQPFLSQISLFLCLLFEVFKKQYQTCLEPQLAVSFRRELDDLFASCLLLIDSEYNEVGNLGQMGKLLQDFIDIFANMEGCGLVDKILILIERRHGFYDECLQKICRKQIAGMSLAQGAHKMKILNKIYDVVIVRNRPLYFSLLLDFAEKNRADAQVKAFLQGKGEEMNEVLGSISFEINHNIRYLNSIVLNETTDSQLNDSRLAKIADTLQHLLNFMGNSELEYQRVLEVVQKSVSSIKRKSTGKGVDFHLVHPFLVFLCQALEKIRYDADLNLCPIDLETCRIVLQLSEWLRNIALMLREVHLSGKTPKKCEALLKFMLDLRKCKWIKYEEISIPFRVNILLCVFWLRLLAPVLPLQAFPSVNMMMEMEQFHSKICEGSKMLKKSWEGLVPLMIDPSNCPL